ncbi:NAD(P)-binding domain-containing protein [Methylobacterium sp. J-077]|uniref:NAD(P)-binding domain-containing protein n=1 Tax=Methylobacterium sp. J-077 TaxID=2836656 RepID=UPI001FBB3659|nr:NAD(P)/FAD-dependent oxidoreductase [Methylobacterium sp. J-077]MCJ2124015.1 NAD(P)/FAD-dependent oxidoreductase [Methylobacterium sp. J-077]
MNASFDGIGLDALTAAVGDNLARTAHPSTPWLTPRTGPDGRQAYDVVVVGAGQSGLAIAFGLMRSGVANILVLDRARAGSEGPWTTYARMHTLRSPKEFTGPDLGVPSLTYQSWHEARFGRASWEALGLIPKALWAEYLVWFRGVTALPVSNNIEVTAIGPAGGGLLAVETLSPGASETRYARKVVLATGQEGMGRWASLPALEGLPVHFRATTADPIDFTALAGKTVAVVGAGASAFDNAATALEAGARVHLLCRRAVPQTVQPYRWLTFTGFLRHLSELDDAWRWRFMATILAMREGFPQPTYDRCASHAGFHLHEGAPVLEARQAGDRVALHTPNGHVTVDFVIAATGIVMDFSARPELRHLAHNIATWADRYTPPEEEANAHAASFPYLADDYALTERDAGATPWIRDIHLFGIASTMSFGPSGASINAMTTAVPKLVAGITRGLFRDDIKGHWAAFQAYDVPQAILRMPTGPGTGLATFAGDATVRPGQACFPDRITRSQEP